MNTEILLNNLEKIHTTPMGSERIKKNLKLSEPPVAYCIKKITDNNTVITHKGKNWYAENENEIITINAYSYTIITAHQKKK